MTTPKDRHGKPLHGAALAAHQRAGHRGKKRNPAASAGGKSNPPNAPNPGRRRRRRNPNLTFVQAAGRVLGAAAAMFGSGVVVTLGAAKLESMTSSKLATYVPSVVALGLGAGIATRYPLVGAGVAAGGAAPFVLPVASRMLQPAAAPPAASTVSALRAVAMGGTWRALNQYPGRGVGAVSMRSVHAT